MNLRLTANLMGGERVWTLDESPARAGRSSANPIAVPDGTVSKEHAEFVRAGNGWTVRDLGSRNGTRLNGVAVTTAVPLAPGDRLELGQVALRVSALAETTFGEVPSIGSSLELRVPDLLLRTSSGTGGATPIVRLLLEADQLLVRPRPLPETCETLLAFVERAIPSNRLVMLLRRQEGGELEQAAARARGATFREPLALSSSVVRTVLEENKAVIAADATSDPRFKAQESIVAQAIHSAMAVPLWDNEQVLGILYVDSITPATIYGQSELELLTLLGNKAAMKITNARLLESEEVRQRLLQEAATATRIQQVLLPGPPRDVAGWHFHARIETCHEVGGDLYDFHRRDDGTLVVLVGDVSGKGMGAALLMSSILSSARVLYDAVDGPLALVRGLNRVMHRSSDGRSFVTVFVAWLDPAAGAVRYVNAGHPEGCIVGAGGVRALEATGIPVGMLPDFPWQEGEATIAPGEMLALFSDGIPEAQRGDEFFDMERVHETLRAAASPDVDAAADQIVKTVDAFVGDAHRGDDVTLLLVRRDD